MDNCMVLSIPIETLNSPEFMALTCHAKALFFDIGTQLQDTPNGQLSCTWAAMEARGWKSRETLGGAICCLISAGFLKKTAHGGSQPKGQNRYKNITKSAFSGSLQNDRNRTKT